MNPRITIFSIILIFAAPNLLGVDDIRSHRLPGKFRVYLYGTRHGKCVEEIVDIIKPE